MKVKDLIKELEQFPQDLDVAYRCFSEQAILDENSLEVMDLCVERKDGWIQNKRPDKPTKQYLVFPGN